MLNSTKTILSKDRNVPVDIFRALAIISVVLYHFNGLLPYGYLGVELFFVISGLLVSGILIKNLEQGKSINYFRFILQRGFKIWPSYYTLFIAGGILAWILYRNFSPDQIIPLWDIKRYLFFYQNYVPGAWHWSFDHIWSLCVEEHFYILLPILFIVVQRFFNQRKFLFFFVSLVILAGILLKIPGYYLTHSHDTTAMTQYRIDALGWGVMLNLLITYYPERLKKYALILFTAGVLILITTLVADQTFGEAYHKILFPSLIPIAFFLMISGAYFVKISGLKLIRYIAYYSYNLYLWHPIWVKYISAKVGTGLLGLSVYLFCSAACAFIFTVLIEEKALSKRGVVLNWIFRKGRTSIAPQTA